MDQTQQQHQTFRLEPRHDPFREYAPGQSTCCAGSRYPSDLGLGFPRIELLAEQGPEPGKQQSPQPEHVQIDQHRGYPGLSQQQDPFAQVQHAADEKGDGQQAGW